MIMQSKFKQSFWNLNYIPKPAFVSSVT